MMTGDSRETATSIARQLHILNANVALEIQVQSGQSFDSLEPQQQEELVRDITVFYRATPQHKLSIVRAWQSNGAIVAMTGDGVNDAPALKMADIGIAMGLSGTDVSKEAADMILVDDNFQTILAAIEEGKSIYHNIKNFVRFQLSTAIAALTLITLSTVRRPCPREPQRKVHGGMLTTGSPAQRMRRRAPPHADTRPAQPPQRHADPVDQHYHGRAAGAVPWVRCRPLRARDRARHRARARAQADPLGTVGSTAAQWKRMSGVAHWGGRARDSVEPVDADVMRQPPRNQKDPIIDRALIQRVLLSAFWIVAGTIFVYMVRSHARMPAASAGVASAGAATGEDTDRGPAR